MPHPASSPAITIPPTTDITGSAPHRAVSEGAASSPAQADPTTDPRVTPDTECREMSATDARTAPSPLVRLVAASVSYGDTLALRPTTLTVESGATTVVSGANGAGKSTLLALIAGVIEPSDGAVERRRPRASVAYIPQRSRVSDSLPVTVVETVRMGRWASIGPLRRMRAADHALVAHHLAALELDALRDRPLHSLSGGQRQRALVAQGLAQQAELLILDEPDAGLDARAHDLIREALAAETARGAAVVHATHDPAVIEAAPALVRLG